MDIMTLETDKLAHLIYKLLTHYLWDVHKSDFLQYPPVISIQQTFISNIFNTYVAHHYSLCYSNCLN